MVASNSENEWECLARNRCGALQIFSSTLSLKVKFAPVAVADLKRLGLTDHMMSHHFHNTGIPHVPWNEMFYSVNNICNHIIITSYYHEGKKPTSSYWSKYIFYLCFRNAVSPAFLTSDWNHGTFCLFMILKSHTRHI